MVAVIRIGETGAAAWQEVESLFVRPLGTAPTLAELYDRLVCDGVAEDSVFIENCLIPDVPQTAGAVPRYRFVHYHGAGGVGRGRHLVRVN